MDKLTLIRARMQLALQVVTVLMLIAATLGQPPHTAAGETSGTDSRAASGLSATADFTWISGLHDDIRGLSGADSVPQSGILEEVGSIWHDRIKGMASDSLRVADSPLEKLFGIQIDYVTSLLEGQSSPSDNADPHRDAHLDESVGAIKELSSLSPLVLASRDSMRSSLLVVSSVGCACEIERCSRMTELFGSLQADTLGGPVAMVDLMQVPSLEDLLGCVTIPYWVFFSEIGEVSTVIEGASDAGDVRASVVSWLGLRRAESRKEDEADAK
jgi:hypothetical protein